MNDRIPTFNPKMLENVARKICELRGEDPDELVRVPHPEGYAVALKKPRFHTAIPQVRQMFEAMLACAALNLQPDDVLEDSTNG